MPFTILTGGSFTSTGAGVQIPLPSSADYFRTWNVTQLAAAAPTAVVGGEWFGAKFGAGQSPVNGGIRWKKAGSSALLIDSFTTTTASSGFTYVQAFPAPEPAVTGTAVSNANPAAVAMVNTFSEGDRVILTNTTGMLQIAGMSFTISTVTGAGFNLVGLNAAGFANPATAVVARRIPQDYPVEPEFMYITGITRAAQAVVTVSIAHQYVVGQKVRFSVPPSFGMQEINGLTGTIIASGAGGAVTAVGSYQFTVDINSSSFATAFAFPASAGSPTTQLFATVAPAGQSTQFNPVTGVQTGYNFTFAPFHSGLFLPYMFLAGGAQSPAGANADVINWMAYQLEN